MLVKKIFTSFFVFALLVSCFAFGGSNQAFAKNGEDTSQMKATKVKHIFYDDKEKAYFDEKEGGYIGEVYTVENGEIVDELTPDEYIDLLAKQEENEKNLKKDQSPKVNTDIQALAGSSYWVYKEDSNSDAIFYGGRASIIQQNPGPESDEFQISYSWTEGYEITGSGSIGTEAKYAIQAGVGFTWVSSATVASTHTMTIPAGYEGYWRFDPRNNISYGSLYVVDSNSGYMTLMDDNIRAFSPAKMGSQLDGNLVSIKQRMSQ